MTNPTKEAYWQERAEGYRKRLRFLNRKAEWARAERSIVKMHLARALTAARHHRGQGG